jgi:hypothetical protein
MYKIGSTKEAKHPYVRYGGNDNGKQGVIVGTSHLLKHKAIENINLRGTPRVWIAASQ